MDDAATVIQVLNDLGFTNCEVVGENSKEIITRIRTTKGWAYEKFPRPKIPGCVYDWAQHFEPAE